MKNSNKYYTPDPVWSVQNISNLIDHQKKLVITSSFHDQVHNDILESYKTVEYLMAHSYYHWPMYDEARRKILGIVEMAIKLRSQQLNNSLEYFDKRKRNRKKILAQLINELTNYGYPQPLINRLHWARELRNSDSHPDRHGFGGAILMHAFYTIAFYPVLTNARKQIESHIASKPIIKFIKNMKLNDLCIEGFCIESNQGIKIIKTNIGLNLNKYHDHLSEISETTKNDQHLYYMSLNYEAKKALELMLYNSWKHH